MIVCTMETSEQQIQFLDRLWMRLQTSSLYKEKIATLDEQPSIKKFLQSSVALQQYLQDCSEGEVYAIKSIIAIGQGPIVFRIPNDLQDPKPLLRSLVSTLLEVEKFYEPIGGIIGYHSTVLKLIHDKEHIKSSPLSSRYHHPVGLNIDAANPEIDRAIRWGIDQLFEIAELYPVGGAGDRLNLVDEKTQTLLPAAVLPFLGKTLLEGLIRDLQAREYLYFKLSGRQTTTPVAMMTSEEKNNHSHMMNICSTKNWFGRGKESFFFFMQPLVPVITREGNWSLVGPLQLSLKPGGHGVIWKLAEDKGAFDWLATLHRKKLLIRQINNPIAGIDHGLLAFSGLGSNNSKAFGFMSCERRLNAPEGVDIITESKSGEGYDYCMTNIEYTEFEQRGITETPLNPDSPYSSYPCNTNILFADIPSIRSALEKCPFPGKLINMKQFVPYTDSSGNTSYIEGGRLETTMQNIADTFIFHSTRQLKKNEFADSLQTFLTYNKRIKTISTTKKSYHAGEPIADTPEQAFYDLQDNCRDLLANYCDFSLPGAQTAKEYLSKGPNILFLYHPALGPVYNIIAQKVSGGAMAQNSELQLEIAEVDIKGLELDGSLLITATQPLGTVDSDGILSYSHGNSCVLHNVKVRNKGIDREAANIYWRNQISRHEAVEIVLEEGAEFHAEDVVFEGAHKFIVPSGYKLTVRQGKGKELIKELQPISKPSWHWEYSYDSNDKIILKKAS